MKIKRYNRKPLIIVLSITVATLLVGGSALAIHFSMSKQDTPSNNTTNLERSDTEKAVTENLQNNPDQKLKNDQKDIPETPTASTNSKASVNVLITNAGIYNGTVKVGGMVTNIAEEGGSCTYTFTSGGNVITKTINTLVNPTSTTCETTSFSSDELSIPGTWKVVLSYASSTAEGTSSEKDITK